MFIDDAYAHLYALSLSAQGKSSPNPNVAAAIYSAHGDLIFDGIHDRTKSIDPAEVVAITKAGAAARGATIVISLEPCAHTGATPPCTQAIIDAGISKVIYAVSDPNPIAAGGAQKLRDAGVEVEHVESAELEFAQPARMAPTISRAPIRTALVLRNFIILSKLITDSLFDRRCIFECLIYPTQEFSIPYGHRCERIGQISRSRCR